MMIVFNKGETRHVKATIESCKNEDFEIIRANYVLKKKSEKNPEDEGSCNIYEHTIDTVISPKEYGTYLLTITYFIADETLIDNVEIRVI